MRTILIERYSDALVQAALEKNLENEVFDDLHYLSGIVDENRDNKHALEEVDSVPGCAEFLAEVLIKKLEPSPLVESLINILAKRRRLEILPEVLHRASVKMKANRKIVAATVTSARELDPDEKNQIQERLNQRTGWNVEVLWKLDPELLGGFIVKSRNRVIDGSLKTRLKNIKAHLLRSEGVF